MSLLTRTDRRTRMHLTPLESREVPAAPTAAEQLFLERLNDARANPTAYGTSIGIDLSYIAPSQPLAFDERLIDATRAHSQDMNDRAYFSHTGAGGSNPGQRMSAAGYPWQGWAESIAAGYSTPEVALRELIIDTGIPNLGHRHHLLSYGGSAGHRDIGVGIVQNGSGPYRHYYTADSGQTADTRPALVGVAYRDTNANGRYDSGEGLGGVTVTVTGVGSTATWSSGGYAVKLNPGTYTVTASGGGVGTFTQQVTVGGANQRLNVLPGQVDVSGPRVSAGAFTNPGVSVAAARFTFDEPINQATFTAADVTLTGPGGSVTVSGVAAVAGSNNTQFDVTFPTQSAIGTYTLSVGPDVRDVTGNPMNQDGDGTNGEDPADRFGTSVTLPVTVTIIDDGDAGFAAGAGWAYSPPPSGGYPYYGADHYYRLGAANGAAVTWTASGLSAGTYRVSATWFAWSNRATDATYQVVDAGGTVLATRTVNQQLAPADRTANGTTWADLGTVSAAGPLTVRLLGSGNQYLIADAARFELTTTSPPPPPPPAAAVTIIDDGDAGFAAGAGWASNPNAGGYPYFQGDHHFRLGATNAPAATWTAAGLTAGTYRVSVTWVEYSNRATNATYQVVDAAGTVLATRTVNQQLRPASRQADGVWWEDLGTVSAAGPLTVRLLGSGNQYLIADAARFEAVNGGQGVVQAAGDWDKDDDFFNGTWVG